MRIEQVEETTAEVVGALGRLLPQLVGQRRAPSREELAEVIASPGTVLIVARGEEETIVGTLTLVLYRLPVGLRAWIEDVVVDKAARGRGVGEAMTREAIRLAGEAGARHVDLTSRPDRVAANRLYSRLGFERRETNVYRYTLE